jgi:hypothetical protein
MGGQGDEWVTSRNGVGDARGEKGTRKGTRNKDWMLIIIGKLGNY